jgi:hypothetical protein
LFVLDQVDVALGSSGAPVFGAGGIAGIVLKKSGSDSAIVASIIPILRLLKQSGIDLDPRISQALDYYDARALGVAYVKVKEADAKAQYPDAVESR